MYKEDVLVLPTSSLREFTSPDVELAAVDAEKFLATLSRAGTFRFRDDALETDESFRQVIPYIVLRDKAGRIFLYQRGDKQEGEKRLAGNMTIGVGGHVGITPGSKAPADLGHAVLEEHLYRELAEEVGLQKTDIVKLSLTHLLVSNRDAVARVHMGLIYMAWVDDATKAKVDGVEVVRGEWLTRTELYARTYAAQNIDGWTLILLEHEVV